MRHPSESRGFILVSLLMMMLIIGIMSVTLIEKEGHYEKFIKAVDITLNVKREAVIVLNTLIASGAPQSTPPLMTDEPVTKSQKFGLVLSEQNKQWQSYKQQNLTLAPNASIKYAIQKLGLFLALHGKTRGCTLLLYRYSVAIKANRLARAETWEETIAYIQKGIPHSQHRTCHGKRILSIRRQRQDEG